jgi:feruloyl esterase
LHITRSAKPPPRRRIEADLHHRQHLIKLNVGPGNPGPADAPSTSPGIGLEVWLPTPSNWNQRVHAVGSGGWGGGKEGSTTEIQNSLNAGGSAAAVAGTEGAVSVSTDTGHSDTVQGGSFAMNPDATISSAQWRDFSQRSVHHMAVQTKALAKAYYGSAPLYAYFDGGSMGGRQAFTAPQVFPEDFDGILVAFPAMNWNRFITWDLYPQVVFQRDLGGVAPTQAQQDLVSNAAIGACDAVGGQHLGYILDPSQCRYDPTKDAQVLCNGVAGNGGVVGTNTTASCVTLPQATAMNKLWYGMTSDGSVADPAVDMGWSLNPTGALRWGGLSRGAGTYVVASGLAPFSIASDVVALELQDPTIADSAFINATGNGQSRWKNLSYSQLSNAFDRGVALQGAMFNVDANNPDLSAFKARGGKIIHYHGLADIAIPAQGSIYYYDQVRTKLGGQVEVDSFYKLYLVPSMGHGFTCAAGGFFCSDFTDGFVNGSTNAAANPPLPNRLQMYAALRDWVEKGIAPDALPASTPASSPVAKSMPICAYPKKITFVSGDPLKSASYTCQ